jgi:predicted outer membrane repeat protein
LNIENPSATVTIKNVVLVNGKGDNGGIINSNAENLALVNCILSNSIANNGSSIYSHGGKLHLKDCPITNNFVTDNWPITSLSGNISLEGCTFKNNTALEKGGCIYIKAPATKGLKSSVHRLNIVNSTFIGNDAAELGGVIYSDGTNILMESCAISRNKGTSPVKILNGRAVLKNSDLSENAGPYTGLYGGFGGGIGFESCSAAVENCTIRHNKAIFQEDGEYFGQGAGIYLIHSNVTMNDTLVEGNEAFGSAGILVTSGSTLEINRGEISRNIARNTYLKNKIVNGIGAGISIWPRSRVTLDSVTFESNHADNSIGAIANCGLLTLTVPNKFMDNTAKNDGAIYNYVYNNESS